MSKNGCEYENWRHEQQVRSNFDLYASDEIKRTAKIIEDAESISVKASQPTIKEIANNFYDEILKGNMYAKADNEQPEVSQEDLDTIGKAFDEEGEGYQKDDAEFGKAEPETEKEPETENEPINNVQDTIEIGKEYIDELKDSIVNINTILDVIDESVEELANTGVEENLAMAENANEGVEDMPEANASQPVEEKKQASKTITAVKTLAQIRDEAVKIEAKKVKAEINYDKEYKIKEWRLDDMEKISDADNGIVVGNVFYDVEDQRGKEFEFTLDFSYDINKDKVNNINDSEWPRFILVNMDEFKPEIEKAIKAHYAKQKPNKTEARKVKAESDAKINKVSLSNDMYSFDIVRFDDTAYLKYNGKFYGKHEQLPKQEDDPLSFLFERSEITVAATLRDSNLSDEEKSLVRLFLYSDKNDYYKPNKTEAKKVNAEDLNMIKIFIGRPDNPVQGEWVTLPVEESKLQSIISKIGTEEPIISDYEAPFKIGEYDDIFELNKYAQQYSELDSYQKAAFTYYVNDGKNIDETMEKITDSDYDFMEAGEDDYQFGEKLYKEGLYNLEDIESLVKYERLAQDYESKNSGGYVYVDGNRYFLRTY